MNKNIYAPTKALIKEVIDETPAIKTFVLEPGEDFIFSTGQFVELSVPGVGEAPFTPSSDPAAGDEIEVTIMKAGKITSVLHEMAPGDALGIRGPYGKGYPLDKFEGKDVLIVGGGVGLAPLRSLLFALFGEMERFKRLLIRYGARTPDDIVYKRMIDGWSGMDGVDFKVTVDRGDEGWKGSVGVVTTILDDMPLDRQNTSCVVCGPPIMMKFAVAKLLELGFLPPDIYLSMEKNMSCGLGKCGHCRIGPYYACKDGPVFTFEQLKDLHDIWD